MVDFNEAFYYKDGKLFNKNNRGSRAKKDQEAGNIDGKGYRIVGVFGRQYQVHRIIWEMFNGAIPEGMEIDHINHNSADNRIENLRVVSHYENKKNNKLYLNNTSGVTGVSWDKKRSKWYAYIAVNKKMKNLGLFNDLELAELVATEAREKYGYHENHGAK